MSILIFLDEKEGAEQRELEKEGRERHVGFEHDSNSVKHLLLWEFETTHIQRKAHTQAEGDTHRKTNTPIGHTHAHTHLQENTHRKIHTQEDKHNHRIHAHTSTGRHT